MAVSDMVNNLRAFLHGALNDNMIHAAINRAYDGLLRRRTWSACLAHGPLNTLAPYSAGSVSVSVGSTSVSGSGTSWSSSYEEAFIRFNAEDNYYKITEVGGATSLTLATAYAGPSNLSGASYTIFKHIYGASTDARQILSVEHEAFLHPTSQYRINRVNPSRTTSGSPSAWAPAGMDSSGNLILEIHPVPDGVYNLTVHYVRPRTAALGLTGVPLLPEPLIEAHALMWCYRMLSVKGPEWLALAQDQANLAENLLIEYEMEDSDRMQGEDAARNVYLENAVTDRGDIYSVDTVT